jgi:hypothetical protein
MRLDDWEVIGSFLNYYGKVGSICHATIEPFVFYEATIREFSVTLFLPINGDCKFSLYLQNNSFCLVSLFDIEEFYSPSFREDILGKMKKPFEPDGFTEEDRVVLSQLDLIFIKT